MSSKVQIQEVPSVSFTGSGFMATYQLGVAQCFVNNAPWLLLSAPFILGASAGSLVAASVVCDINLAHIRDEMLFFASRMKAFTLGPLNPSVNVFHWLERVIRTHLPNDAHHLANGRLAVAMTRLSDGKNIVISEFKSKDEIVQALLCSCFLPGYCGVVPPTFNGVRYLDGGFTSLLPTLTTPTGPILTVSSFSGEMDICPRDATSLFELVVGGASFNVNQANVFRAFNALYPMDLEDALSFQNLEQAYHSGYKDAIHFFQRNDILPYSEEAKMRSMLTNKWTLMGLEERTVLADTKLEEMEKSTEVDFACNHVEQDFFLNLIHDALLCNMLGYVSMFGVPMMLFYFLLPLTLPLCFILQNNHGWELWLRQTPMILFWAWQGLKQSTIFITAILVSTIKKNLEKQAENEGPIDKHEQQYSPHRLALLSSPPTPSKHPMSTPHAPSCTPCAPSVWPEMSGCVKWNFQRRYPSNTG